MLHFINCSNGFACCLVPLCFYRANSSEEGRDRNSIKNLLQSFARLRMSTGANDTISRAQPNKAENVCQLFSLRFMLHRVAVARPRTFHEIIAIRLPKKLFRGKRWKVFSASLSDEVNWIRLCGGLVIDWIAELNGISRRATRNVTSHREEESNCVIA